MGWGSCIPTRIVKNEDFLEAEFFQENGERFPDPNDVIIRKFEKITGIKERRYAEPGQKASDLGAIAAKNAIEDSNIDANDLDYIIFAHNFGDMQKDNNRIDMMPSLAARVKGTLGNHQCFLPLVMTLFLVVQAGYKALSKLPR